MEPGYLALTLGILGVWRITHLLNAEDGPGRVLVALRKAAGSGFWGQLMDCFQCLSLWVSAPFALIIGRDRLMRGLLWLAFSAGAILLERVTSRDEAVSPPITYTEDPPDGKQ
jgi:hypothetical protein